MYFAYKVYVIDGKGKISRSYIDCESENRTIKDIVKKACGIKSEKSLEEAMKSCKRVMEGFEIRRKTRKIILKEIGLSKDIFYVLF